MNRLDRKKSQWLVATRTDGYWASLVGFIFSFLFFLWPIIILKRRRNACGLGNKVAVSYYLVETQKKNSPENIVNIYKYHFFQVLVPFSVVWFSSVISKVGAFALNLIDDYTARAALCDWFHIFFVEWFFLTFLVQIAINVDFQFPGVIRWKVHLLLDISICNFDFVIAIPLEEQIPFETFILSSKKQRASVIQNNRMILFIQRCKQRKPVRTECHPRLTAVLYMK